MARDSRTHKAVERQRDAGVQRCQAESLIQDGRYPPVVAEMSMMRAEMSEREAERYLTLTEAPDIRHGEVARPVVAGMHDHAFDIANTLDVSPTAIAIDASIHRSDLLAGKHVDVLALGIDAAQSIQANNSMEKMLAHQMAMAHKCSMQTMDKAMGWLQHQSGNQVAMTEAARLMNASAKLMQSFQQGLMTMQKLRTGGQQTVTVQHVHVADGGQAVIGNVQTRAGLPEGGPQK